MSRPDDGTNEYVLLYCRQCGKPLTIRLDEFPATETEED